MNVYNKKLVANRIRECRVSRGISQEELGRLLGKTRTNIANYEAGRVIVPSDVMVILAKTLKVSADYLLGLSDNPFSENNIQIKKLNIFLNNLDDEKQKRAIQILKLVFKENNK